jgi:hypothetical protein
MGDFPDSPIAQDGFAAVDEKLRRKDARWREAVFSFFFAALA